MTKAFMTYDVNRKYTKDLNSIYNYIHSVSPAFNISQLLRSEYALIISSFDRYIHDLVRERLLYKFSSNCIESDDNTIELSLYKVQELMKITDPIQKELLLDTYIHQAIASSSFQAPRSVEYALSLIGINKVWTLVSPGLAMQAKDIRDSLSLYVNRRNKIVHEADLDVFTNVLSSIDLETVNSCDTFISNLIGAIETLIY